MKCGYEMVPVSVFDLWRINLSACRSGTERDRSTVGRDWQAAGQSAWYYVDTRVLPRSSCSLYRLRGISQHRRPVSHRSWYPGFNPLYHQEMAVEFFPRWRSVVVLNLNLYRFSVFTQNFAQSSSSKTAHINEKLKQLTPVCEDGS